MLVEFLLVGPLHGKENEGNDHGGENDMRGEDKIIDMPQGPGLLLLDIAQHSVVVEIAKTGGGIGSMIDHIGNEENGTETDGDPVGAAVRGHLSVLYKIQTGQQEDSRARIEDRMKQGERPRVETRIQFGLWPQDKEGYSGGDGDRHNYYRPGIVFLR